MTELMPVNFPTQPELAIASYDYADIAEGTGIIKFEGFIQEDSAAQTNALSSNATYSYKIETEFIETGGADYTKRLDMDFDLSPFTLPKIIKGTGIIEQGAAYSSPAGNSVKFYLVYKLRKWDGTAETEIASVQTPEITSTQLQTLEKIFNCKITIPKTKFKKGETLRLTIEGWSKSNPNPYTGNIFIGHDPMNRDGSGIIPSTEDVITNFRFYCPFMIDL